MNALAILLSVVVTSPPTPMSDTDWFEAGYYEGELDGGGEIDAVEYRGERRSGNWLLIVSREIVSASTPDASSLLRADAISRTLRLGSGYLFDAGNSDQQVIAGVGLALSTLDASIASADPDFIMNAHDNDAGYFVALGFRKELAHALSGEVRHRFTDVHGEHMNDWRVDLSYSLTADLAITASYRDFDGDNAIGGGLRWIF